MYRRALIPRYSPCLPPWQWPGPRDPGPRLSGLSPGPSVHRATQCVTLPVTCHADPSRIRDITSRSHRGHKSVWDTTSGVFITHDTSDMKERKHNIDFGWPGVFASLQKSGCGVSKAETICARLAAFSNGFSLVWAV